jgi:hypothetical protein
MPGGRNWKNSDFRCLYCQNYVSAAVMYAGVQNRNHCPYCLWSKHLDLYQSGDRMAICKMGMRPVGLTLKQVHKKYTYTDQGELMIIHHCQGCDRISINRIATDDDPDRILAILDASLELAEITRQKCKQQGIVTLDDSQRWVVLTRLFGSVEPSRMGEPSPFSCG